MKTDPLFLTTSLKGARFALAGCLVPPVKYFMTLQPCQTLLSENKTLGRLRAYIHIISEE